MRDVAQFDPIGVMVGAQEGYVIARRNGQTSIWSVGMMPIVSAVFADFDSRRGSLGLSGWLIYPAVPGK
jgi:hypothetical protein